MKEYSAVPAKDAFLYNYGAKLNLNKKSARLSLGKDRQAEAEMNFVEIGNGLWEVLDDEEAWVLDIKGKEIKAGAVVKFNVRSDTRKTQTWIVETLDDNTFMIRLGADPSYFVSYNKSTNELVLSNEKDSTGYYKWQAFSNKDTVITLTAKQQNGKIEISGVAPEKYESGNIDIKITNSDGTYNEITASAAVKDGKFSTTIDKTLPAGTYIFSAVNNGTVYGYQYIYTVR